MTENNLKDISSMDLAGLTEFILSLGEKKFRAHQIYDWINKKNAVSFAEMTDLSKVLREKLAGEAFLEDRRDYEGPLQDAGRELCRERPHEV